VSAFNSIPENYYELCNLLRQLPVPAEDTFKNFKEGLDLSTRRICIGVGRSGDIADVFAKFLRNLGYTEVHGPEDIPYIFEPSDLVIAYSGSGTSTFTVETAKIAKEANAKLVSLTSNLSSPLEKLSDYVIHIPGKTKTEGDYYARQLLGAPYASLTPLGTSYELRALFLTLSFVGSVVRGTDVCSCYDELRRLCEEYAPPASELLRLYELMPKPRSAMNPTAGKTVVIGEGLSGMVGKFFVTRLRHCARQSEERECYFFKDKGSVRVKENDLAFVISGSGNGVPLRLGERAKKNNVRLAVATSYADSPLAKMADVPIIIPGRTIERTKGLRSSYFPKDPRKSLFELRTILALETFIYAVAQTEGVTEFDMGAKHSEFV